MTHKLPALGKTAHKLLVKPARNINGVERAVRGDDAVELAGLALLDEFRAAARCGADELGDAGEGLPEFGDAGGKVRSDRSWVRD